MYVNRYVREKINRNTEYKAVTRIPFSLSKNIKLGHCVMIFPYTYMFQGDPQARGQRVIQKRFLTCIYRSTALNRTFCQTKENQECSKMVASILPTDPR